MERLLTLAIASSLTSLQWSRSQRVGLSILFHWRSSVDLHSVRILQSLWKLWSWTLIWLLSLAALLFEVLLLDYAVVGAGEALVHINILSLSIKVLFMSLSNVQR